MTNVVSLFSSREEQLVADALDASQARNTQLSYASRVRVITAWLGQHDHQRSLTVFEPQVFSAFLASKAAQGAAPDTVVGYWNAWQNHLAKHDVAVPVADKAFVAEVITGLRRAARGYQPTKARALTVSELLAISQACPDNAGGVLDRALILTGASLGLRASDLRALRRKDITVVPGQGLAVFVPFSKTDQQGRGVALALPKLNEELRALDATLALGQWLDVLHHTDQHEALFRGTFKGRNTVRSSPLSPRAVGDLLLSAALRAEVPTEGLSAHSLRASFATGAYGAGVPEREIARTGRWSSVGTQRGYDRASMWSADAAGRWLEKALSQD